MLSAGKPFHCYSSSPFDASQYFGPLLLTYFHFTLAPLDLEKWLDPSH